MTEREFLRSTLDQETRRVRFDIGKFPRPGSGLLSQPPGTAVRISQELLDDPAGIAAIDPRVRAPRLNLDSQLGESIAPNVVGGEHPGSRFHLGRRRRTPVGVHRQEDFDEFLKQLESRVRQEKLACCH